MRIRAKREIIKQWEDGRSIKVILANGYNKKLVYKVLDEYTKKNAKRWIKE